MLKMLPPENLSNKAKEKCGEIFCHSSTDFTICCTICSMKAFSFEDFVLHIKNEHFINNLLKTDEYLEIKVKNEAIDDVANGEEEHWDYVEHSLDDASDISEYEEEEENISVLKKSLKSLGYKRNKNIKSRRESVNDHSSDEDTKPLLKEQKLVGPVEKSYQCEQCNKSYKNLGLLKAHKSRIHDKNSHDKVVKTPKTHTAEKSFECHFEGCGKKYLAKFDLKRHLESHATERNFICDFENCGKAFKSAHYLQRHSTIHTRPKDLVCDICGYTCKKTQNLKIHLRRHTGEKPFACEVCDKRFISTSARIEHMNTHSNERRHVCKVCNASFGRQKSLYHHSFLHLDVKKFKCKLCVAAFKQAAGLAGHMRKHQEDHFISRLPVAEQQTL